MARRVKNKKNLLDDDDSEGVGPSEIGIRVNKEYAARFEHNKRREELHRLQSKYPEEAEKLARKIARETAKAAGQGPAPADQDEDDSSDDEEEDEGEIPDEVEAKIFDTLLRIRSQDPAIYQKDVQFFEEGVDDEDDDGTGAKEKAKKAKPVYLKDMIAKQALEYGPAGDSDDDDGAAGRGKKIDKDRHPKVYDQEQEALRKAFLEAVQDTEGGEVEAEIGVLQLRSKGPAGDTSSDDDDAKAADQKAACQLKSKRSNKRGAKGDSNINTLVEAYFGTEGELNSDDKFLKEYIMNKGWVDREDDYVPSYREIVGDDEDGNAGGPGVQGIDDDEDEEYLRTVDAFEATYNFRFEEPGADRIITHPRNIEGTVRKLDDKRRRQRDAKKQRLEEAAEAAREEVKRLKNLKKQEIESKLDKLRQVAGAAAPAATSLDDMLEGDFDPEEWDKKMAAAFNDEYYAVEEDLDLQEDLDLLGKDMISSDEEDGVEDGGEAGAVRFRTIQQKIKEVDAMSEEPEGDDGGACPDPEVIAKQRAELQRLLEDYYKLDYEDNVGGIKTRFRYKEVPATTFGLSVDNILRLDDKKLNQVVGIKRLAPYREDLSKLRPNYKALEMIKGEMANVKQRRQHKKREWQKGQGDRRQGRQWWRDEGDGDGGGEAAAGPGPRNVEAARAGADMSQRNGRSGKGHHDAKAQAQPRRDHAGKPGPGLSSEAAAAGDGRNSKKRKQQGDATEAGRNGNSKRRQLGIEQQQQLDPQQARLASYAVPTLKKEPWGSKDSQGSKRKGGAKGKTAQGGDNDGPADGLSRAQRKNLKRSLKRASKRVTEEGCGE